MINFAAFIHLELTNKCNKNPGCWMCGRRKLEKEYPHLANFNKDMDLDLAKKIIDQLPLNTVVHYHNSGESLLYPHLKEILKYSENKVIRHFDSNCILLLDKANDIIDNLEVLTVSVIENDPLQDKQFEIIKKFLKLKRDRKPRVVFRLLGNISKRPLTEKEKKEVDKLKYPILTRLKIGIIKNNSVYLLERKQRWYDLAKKYNCLIATRTLHDPMGSYNYEKKVTIPEYGVCQEILTHISIDVEGNVFPCVRFNPSKYNLLGNVKCDSLYSIWNGKKRLKLLKLHVEGKRDKISLCNKCEYWGIQIG
jgi:radical SAM protein with 4Fe4S-binding SPASM domain